jgi:hypothetical protein
VSAAKSGAATLIPSRRGKPKATLRRVVEIVTVSPG